MNPRIQVTAAILVAGVTSLSGVAAARATAASQYTVSAKQIVWSGKVVSEPVGLAAIDPAAHNYTTYMPIWYVMQALKNVGIQSGWDGTNWTMQMPVGEKPNTDLTKLKPGSGSKRMWINGVDVQNVHGIVYADPASHQNTTYVPIWYVMKVLKYENITSTWDGHKWSMTPSAVPFSATHDGAPPIASSSGVIPGAASTGTMREIWQNNGQDITLEGMNRALGGNLLPLKGHVNGTRRDDVVVEVYEANDKNWFYSVPVDSSGNFSVTIVLPYQGQDYVGVGYAQTTDFFGMSQTSTYGEFQNNQPTLPDAQMALLQSWMVNYNETSDIHTLAMNITASAQTKDQAIKAVSDWVSRTIYYNFPELNQNQVAWQQATQTLHVQSGVCQDQAAVAAALLRSINIPTKVIGGEAYDPAQHQDIGTHAWNEAWDGTRWVTFDACWDQDYSQTTNVAPPDSVSDEYFDPPAATFSDTHQPDATQPFAWSVKSHLAL